MDKFTLDDIFSSDPESEHASLPEGFFKALVAGVREFVRQLKGTEGPAPIPSARVLSQPRPHRRQRTPH